MNCSAKTILFSIISIFMLSCVSTKKELKQSQAFNAFSEIAWTLQKIVIDEKSYQPLPRTPKPTLYFKSNGVVTGISTINNYFGKVEIAKEGDIDFGTGFGRTMNETSSKQEDQESVFLETLVKMQKLFVQNNYLYLSSLDGKAVMIFSKMRHCR